jgi:hypothetical protein
MIGKRVNLHGEIVTVTAITYDGSICEIDSVIWPGGMVLTRVIREMPEVIRRDSFTYPYELERRDND